MDLKPIDEPKFTMSVHLNFSQLTKGFTLVELLVVIAIIGVLSSVVLSSLNVARAKGADATVKADLAGARSQAELFYDSNGNSYMVTSGTATDVCSPTGSVGNPAVKGVYSHVYAAASATGLSSVNTNPVTAGTVSTATCHASAGAWAAEAPLKVDPTKMYCVDNRGISTTTVGSTLPSGDYACG